MGNVEGPEQGRACAHSGVQTPASSLQPSHCSPGFVALRAGVHMLSIPFPDLCWKPLFSTTDSFNPAEWAKRGGGGLGGGGGFQVPDSFNPADMEREKERTNVAVMDRPSDKLDPGKKYRVLLFNDENNTREYVIEVLMKYIPGMSAEM